MEKVLFLSLVIAFCAMYPPHKTAHHSVVRPADRQEIRNNTRGFYVVAPEKPVYRKVKDISFLSPK